MHRYSNLTDPEKFWTRVRKSPDPDGCWEWFGSHCERGYGRIELRRKSGTHVLLAHRVSYEIAFGSIPLGMFVCHRCDNPKCVRPDHLFLGTHQDNMDDCRAKGRRPKGDLHHARLHPECMARGERCGAAKLTEDQVRAIREEHERGSSLRQLAEKFHISKTNASEIVRRTIWCHVE